jgi:hypothetical protein
MKINWVKIALIGLGYAWWKGNEVVNALHCKITRVHITDLWENLKHGVFVLELTWLLENTSNVSVAVNQFVGQLNWRGNKMALIDLPLDDPPVHPNQVQEMTFVVRGKFIDGIAAILLAVHNPGSRLLDGVTVDGNLTMTVNGATITAPYHQTVSITL